MAVATVTLNIKTSGWGDDTSTSVNGLAWGILVDTDGSGTGGNFSGSFLSDLSSNLNGYTIPAMSGTGNFSSGSVIFDEYYYVAGRAETSNSGPPTNTDGFMDDLGITYGTEITSSDDYGLVWFSLGASSTLGASDFFGFQDIGNLPADGATVSPTTTPGQTLTAVPEPAAYTLLAGCLGLGWVVTRRHRRRA